MSSKKVVKQVPFSPNVVKVIYDDGTYGLKYTGSSVGGAEARKQEPIARPDITEDAPASPEEIEAAMQSMRASGFPRPGMNVEEFDAMAAQRKAKLAYENDPYFRAYSDDMSKFEEIDNDKTPEDVREAEFQKLRQRYPDKIQELDEELFIPSQYHTNKLPKKGK